MALSERERGSGGVGGGWMSLSFAARSLAARSLAARYRALEGPARLTFPDGREIVVEATLSLAQTRFLARGEGVLHCDERHGMAAFDSHELLLLSFGGDVQELIMVHDIKIKDGECRCRFRVNS